MTMLGAGIAILLVAFSVVGLLWVLPAYRRFRREHLLICPETGEPATVAFDAAHVARTAWGGEIDLRLKACSRWPERSGCEKDCLDEVRA
jgi:hypothetical protein